jgi:LemA protein
MIIWLIGGLAVALILAVIYYFNKFAILQNRIENSSSQIDVQLKKRADLIPNIVKSIQGYMKHEKSIITEVTNARKAMLSGSMNSKIKADEKLEKALKTIFALAENYPNLKANENFVKLQEELSAIEDKIAYARQYYNDSILEYDNLFSTFPGNFFAKLFGKKQQEYLKISEAEKDVPKVKFD